MTFDPHPATVLRPGKAPHLLVSTRHKIRLFERAGIGHFLAVRFDEVFAATPPREFVRQLAEVCDPLRRICVGADWAFGRGREGNVGLLREMGGELGFEIDPVSAVCVGGEPVSSTRIRSLVREGNLEAAKPLLGREYTVLGTVVEGRHLGKDVRVSDGESPRSQRAASAGGRLRGERGGGRGDVWRGGEPRVAADGGGGRWQEDVRGARFLGRWGISTGGIWRWVS